MGTMNLFYMRMCVRCQMVSKSKSHTYIHLYLQSKVLAYSRHRLQQAQEYGGAESEIDLFCSS